MQQIVGEVLDTTVREFLTRLAAFAPNLLAMAILLVAGAVIAGVVDVVVRVVLPRLGFDRFASRAGVCTILQKGGISSAPSRVLALLLAGMVLAGFILMATAALNLQVAMELVSKGFLYLPHVLVAIALLFIGTMVAAVVRRTVLIAAVNAGVPSARFMAAAAQAAVVILAIAMALEHLGVGRQVLLVAFAILFGGAVLALALAFGLGAQGLARGLLERAVAPRHPDEPSEDARRQI